MTDTAILQLLGRADTSVATLLVLDENSAALPRNGFAQVQVISNRVDICNHVQSQQWPCSFSDFEFDSVSAGDPVQALYRISKEKRVVEHVLQSLWGLLPVGGTLLCCGYKNEGIKTFAKRAQEVWNSEPELTRGEQHLHFYRFTKTSAAAAALNESDYHALHPVADLNGMTLVSKPGIFAWDRIDNGSAFLLEHLRGFLPADCTGKSGIDLGCGYGLLAVALLQAGCSRVVATDNNAAAIRACSVNLQQHCGSSETAVSAADCAAGIDERFDLLLCNPPFHQGFDVEQDLTERFLLAARRLLHPRGRALFVSNSFIPLERKAEAHFTQVQTLANNGRFRLTMLAEPLRRPRP